ncbi:IS1096 element passenger TnpR family protein [Nitrospira sp. CMX1]
MHRDCTLADLHWTIQIVFGWTDVHLHYFRLRGKNYDIPRVYVESLQDSEYHVRQRYDSQVIATASIKRSERPSKMTRCHWLGE